MPQEAAGDSNDAGRDVFARWLRALSYSPPAILVALAVVTYVVPQMAAAAFALAAGSVLVLVAAAAALALRAGRSPDRPTVLALAAAAVAPALLSLASLQAVNRSVSFGGIAGQHAGAALWLLGWAAFALAAVVGVRKTLLWTLRAIVAVGALYTASAAMQAAGAFGGAPGWGYASAPLENSISLGELLVLSVGAGAAWIAAARSWERWLAGALTGVALVGLLPARSSGAWAGLAFGVAFFGLHAWLSRTRKPSLALAVAWAALAVVAVGALAATSSGVFGAGAADALNSASNNRATIWRSAVAGIAEHPLTGRGPEQFSAWTTWNVPGGTEVVTQGALDAHNALLALTLATGILGAAAIVVAAGALLYLLAEQIRRTGNSLPLRLALAALAGWAASLGFAWVAVLPALAAATLAGALLGAVRAPARSANATGRIVALAAAALTALAVAIALVPVTRLEVDWYGVVSRNGQSADLGARLYAQHPDPTFVIRAEQELMTLALAEKDPALAASAAASARNVSALAARDRVWHSDLAFDAMTLATRKFGVADEAAYRAALADGLESDPTSGLWYFLASRHAQANSRTAEQLAYDRRALAYQDLPRNVRAMLLAEISAGK